MASPFAISLAIFLLIGAAAVALVMAFSGGGRVVEERFADLAVKMRVAQGVDDQSYEDPNLMRALFKWASKRVPAPDLESPEGERLAQQLQQAGYLRSTSAAHAYQVVRIMIAIALGIVGFLAGVIMKGGAQPIMLSLGGAVLGYLGPSYWLGRRARMRQNNIAKQLSDVLDLLCVCVEAGLGLYEAIRIVGVECERQQQEIGTELSMVASDISAGATLGQALRALADRTAVDDIKPLAATLIQSEQLGAQIAPALRASSDALRTRRRLKAEEEAQKASIKILFPLVIFVLPAMIAVIIGPAMIGVIRTLSGGQ